MSHYLSVPWLMDEVLSNRYAVTPVFDNYNFGEVKFLWANGTNNSESSFIQFNIRDINNEIVETLTLSENDLIYNQSSINVDEACENKIYNRFKHLTEYLIYYKNHKSELIVELSCLAIVILLILILLSIVFFIFIKFPFKVCKLTLSLFNLKNNNNNDFNDSTAYNNKKKI